MKLRASWGVGRAGGWRAAQPGRLWGDMGAGLGGARDPLRPVTSAPPFPPGKGCSGISFRLLLLDGPRTKDAMDGPCQVVGVKKYILICLALRGNYRSLHAIINFHMSFQKNLKLFEPQNEIFNLHKYESRPPPPPPPTIFLRRGEIKNV